MNVAWPDVIATLVASVTLPSSKVTVPVGVPAPGEAAATVAVKVTGCPKTDGLAAEMTVVVLESWLTTCGEVESVPVEVWKLPSPE